MLSVCESERDGARAAPPLAARQQHNLSPMLQIAPIS